MTGPKTNEGGTKVGERTGTRAVARYIRVSATKAREVLDLIRGLDVSSADDVLRFTERDVAIVIRKVLASAVANAQNNDAQDPDELKVVACFADEGPTLKRFRPRARGRATRVRKRTCHITIVVGRMSERELELREARQAASPQAGRRAGRGAAAAAAARRERVARSRRAAATTGAEHVDEVDETVDDEADGVVEGAATDEAVEDEVTDEVEADEILDETDETEADETVEEADDAVEDETADGDTAGDGDDGDDEEEDA
jgi:large subunit ribosomal protein L22